MTPEELSQHHDSNHRDVTRAMEHLDKVMSHDDSTPLSVVIEEINYVRELLRDIDARTGRRDPSVRDGRRYPPTEGT